MMLFFQIGSIYAIDGEYVEEGNDILTYNSHPVYRKEGYFGFSSDMYMFLVDDTVNIAGTNAQPGGWFWVVSYVVGSTASNAMLAFCIDSTVDPAQCDTWYSQDLFSSSRNYFVNNDILVCFNIFIFSI